MNPLEHTFLEWMGPAVADPISITLIADIESIEEPDELYRVAWRDLRNGKEGETDKEFSFEEAEELSKRVMERLPALAWPTSV